MREPKQTCVFWEKKVTHVMVLLGPSFGLLVYAMFAQNVFAMTSATSETVLSWGDVLGKFSTEYWGHRQVFFIAKLLANYNLAFGLATLFRILLSYLELPKKNPLYRVLTWTYALILLLHFFLVSVFLGVVSAWFVLASILDPTRFLPYGTAVIVFGVVVKSTQAELSAAAAKMKHAFRNAFDQRLTQSLWQVKQDILVEQQEKMEQKLLEEAGAGNGELRQRAMGWDDDPGAAPAGPPAPIHVFCSG
jgi:hypothetical protein